MQVTRMRDPLQVTFELRVKLFLISEFAEVTSTFCLLSLF